MTSSITEVVGGPDWDDDGSSSWNAFSTERRKKNVSIDSNDTRILVTLSLRGASSTNWGIRT